MYNNNNNNNRYKVALNKHDMMNLKYACKSSFLLKIIVTRCSHTNDHDSPENFKVSLNNHVLMIGFPIYAD